MCAIIGAVLTKIDSGEKVDRVNAILNYIWFASHARGRDGRGFLMQTDNWQGVYGERSTERIDMPFTKTAPPPVLLAQCKKSFTMIGNLRAEPTTEFVLSKSDWDQQPYSVADWSIVHNGTIANDAELRTGKHLSTIDSAAIAEQLVFRSPHGSDLEVFQSTVSALKGSYAILAMKEGETGRLYVAANYRPIWYIVTDLGTFFASARDFFPRGHTVKMLAPYSVGYFRPFTQHMASLYKGFNSDTALVVCSGGLDSVVSAAWAQAMLGRKLHLIHFLYGSRAEGPEVKAVTAVAAALGAELTLFPLPVYRKEDSPLLDPDSKVAGGEAGAEFAHEWVPARNLLLLSVATAFAEARGIDTIVLGNNLEEAGAYPDNEPEFIAKFNDLLPFAVGDGKRMEVLMPVGNMMKHEIVALGNQLKAPMHLTWSCYRAGETHCGTCGPCYMRRKAFEINGLPEVIAYNTPAAHNIAPRVNTAFESLQFPYFIR